MKSSAQLQPGAIYSRDDLIKKFDITDATINNGIFRPKGHDSVWLFVTEEKTPDRVQYIDHLDGDVLLMQGQTQGRTDALIEEHKARGLELLLFHRSEKYERPGAAFRYEGPFNFIRSFGSTPTSFVLMRETGRKFKYGDQPTWRMVLHAVQALGGVATADEIDKFIKSRVPGYVTTNTSADLLMMAVNEYGRGSHSGYNGTARRSDGYSPYDALYRLPDEDAVRYALYDPDKHGVWALAPDDSGKLRPVRVEEIPELEHEEDEAANEGAFDANNKEDARQKALRSIVQRRGQPAFRKKLIAAYGGRCAITDCPAIEVLEAAHITPYLGDHTNHVENGLLLRADVHTLLDLHLLRIHPDTLAVELAPQLAYAYTGLVRTVLRLPHEAGQRPSWAALNEHYQACNEAFGGD